MDWKTCRWSDELTDLLGIDKEKLPTIYDSYEKIGTVTKDAAKNWDCRKVFLLQQDVEIPWQIF